MKRRRTGSTTRKYKRSKHNIDDVRVSILSKPQDPDDFERATLLHLLDLSNETQTAYMMVAPLGYLFEIEVKNDGEAKFVKVLVDGKNVTKSLVFSKMVYQGIDVSEDRLLPFCFQLNEVQEESQSILSQNLEALGVIELKIHTVDGVRKVHEPGVPKFRDPNSLKPSVIEEREAKSKLLSVGTRGEVVIENLSPFHYEFDEIVYIHSIFIFYYDKIAFELEMRNNFYGKEMLTDFEREYLGVVNEPKRVIPTDITSVVKVDLNRQSRDSYGGEATPIVIDDPITRPDQPAVVDPRFWTVADVVLFFQSIDHRFSIYIPAIEENDIDGDALLGLTEQMLKDLKIEKVGHRSKILKAISRIQSRNHNSSVITID